MSYQPHNREAERVVLASVLMRGDDALAELAELMPKDFYIPAHAAIFAAARELSGRGEPIDTVTVEAQLRAVEELRLLDGGLVYLSRLTDAYATTRGLVHHGRTVRELSILRRMIEAMEDVIVEARGAVVSVADFIDAAEQRVLSVCEARTRTDAAIDAKTLVTRTLETMRRRAKGEEVAIKTGLEDFDRLIRPGMEAGDLWIIAGRPSSGKTAVVTTILDNVCVPQTLDDVPAAPGLMFSLEMPAVQLGMRVLAQEARVDLQSLRTCEGLLEDDMARVTQRGAVVARARLHIDDTPALTLLEINARARAWRRTKARDAKIGLIVVDYLQLARGPREEDVREQELAALSRGLKRLAKDLQCVVIALSQLNRKCEDRPGGRPQLSDLRESGAIEQDADAVVLVWREELYLQPKAPESEKARCKNLATLIVAKQRNGPLADVNCVFQKPYARFESLKR